MDYLNELPIWPFTIITGLLGILGAFQLQRFVSFRAAAKEFTDTFHRGLKEVYPIPANWPKDIDRYLRARFDSLSEAVGKFQRHLPKRKQRPFAEAWFRFYCCTGREVDRHCQCYHHYMPFSGTSIVDGKQEEHDNTKTYKENLKHNVDNLLKYARIT